MAKLLDTAELAPADRAEAVAAAMRSARVPARLTHGVPDAEVHARVDLWDLGGGLNVMRRTSSGIGLTRSPRQVRAAAEDMVSLTLLGPGRWRFRQGDAEIVADSARWSAILVDQAAPYEFQRSGDGTTCALQMDPGTSGIATSDLRAAAGKLSRSPLHDLAVDHLLGVARVLDDLPPGPITSMLGTSAVEVMRGLVATTLPDGGTSAPPSAPPSARSLLTASQVYIRRHVTERDLTPASVARAHGVSVRQLYAAWAAHDVTPAGYVMAQRLELARRMLSVGGHGERTISSIAHACGFVDVPHFSRRFRNAYGMSPREWRRESAAGARPPGG